MRSKTTAALLAIFLGGFGIHKFYLGRAGTGIAYLLCCVLIVPFILGFIDGINLLSMNEKHFNNQYN